MYYTARFFVFLSRLLLPMPRAIDRCSQVPYPISPIGKGIDGNIGNNLHLHSRLPWLETRSDVGRRSCVWSSGHTIQGSCPGRWTSRVLHASQMHFHRRGELITEVKCEEDLETILTLIAIVPSGLTLSCAPWVLSPLNESTQDSTREHPTNQCDCVSLA